ncbi:MAG: FAD-binding protein, partial [Spirochaetales bacterium]|nr:FAD-binding protein [Spirochaetales bacterium]
VYSFCMCPGGFIVPATTKNGYQVVNGMSPSNRNGKWANSGMVVQLRCSDIDINSPLSMLEYIKNVEKRCYFDGFKAPSQRMADFINHKISDTLPASSYIPGLVSVNLDDYLPPIVSSSLREGLLKFSSFTRGKFLTNDALLLAPETRTSSPVRISRNEGLFQIKGLYPCGEGAGYAGGIVSAALDGIMCATKLKENYL